MTPSQRMKILRIMHGLTQERLAERAGVSRASVLGWEQGRLPARKASEILAKLLEVNVEYLLEGIHLPTFAMWRPTSPGHPKHLISLASEMEQGLSLLLKELEIQFGFKGITRDNLFWLIGDAPESKEWKLSFLITSEMSLGPAISKAMSSSIDTVDLGLIDCVGIDGTFISLISDELYARYGHHPDVNILYNRLGGLQSEGNKDFTLESLLELFGHKIAHENMSDNDISFMAHFIATNISERSGLSNTKWSSIELINLAAKNATKPKKSLK